MAGNKMAELERAYADHLANACSDDFYRADGSGEIYLASDARWKALATEVYGEAMAERAIDLIQDALEVLSYANVHEIVMQELKSELEDAAVSAAHASDVDIFGHCTQETKNEVTEKFQKMVEIVDRMAAVTPELRRGDAMMLAMLHGMTEKALDYGVELK